VTAWWGSLLHRERNSARTSRGGVWLQKSRKPGRPVRSLLLGLINWKGYDTPGRPRPTSGPQRRAMQGLPQAAGARNWGSFQTTGGGGAGEDKFGSLRLASGVISIGQYMLCAPDDLAARWRATMSQPCG